MRCTVLGGTGFLGTHLTRALATAGHDVVVLSRHPERAQRFAAVRYVASDYAIRSVVGPAIDGADIVFHLVGTSLPASSNAAAMQDVLGNVIGTISVLEEARARGVGRIVFVSSGGTVYGAPRELPIREQHATDPLCSYGITKLAIEKYLNLFRELHALDYRVLRLANPYGPGQRVDRAQGAVAVFLDRARRGQAIEIWGDGTAVRDYVYVEDAIEAVVLAGTHEGETRTMNVGSGTGHSLNALVAAIRAVLKREVEIRWRPARPFDVPANVLDSSLAERELGWRARTALADGLQRTADWLHKYDATAPR